MDAIRTFADSTPLFSCIVGVGLIAFTLEALLMALAVRWRARQRRVRALAEAGDWAAVAAAPVPRPWAELVAFLALLMVPITTVVAVEHARAMIEASLAETSPAARARLLAAGWNGQVTAISLGIVVMELAGGLGVIAWSLAFAARRQIASLAAAARMAERNPAEAETRVRFPRPETETVVACAGSVAAMAFLPALQGAFSYCTLLGKRLAALSGLDPAERLKQMDAILLEARAALDAGTSASQLGLLLAGITCGGLLWWRSPERSRRRWLARASAPDGGGGGRGGRMALATTLACLLVSITLYLVSRPLQAENELPWPALAQRSGRLRAQVRTPDLVGPDRLPVSERAPVLEVTARGARLDGDEVDVGGCRGRLEALRRANREQRPGEPAEDIIVLCEAETPAARLSPFLAAARASGFHRPVFAFVKRETVQRPALGTLARERDSAARTLIEEGGRASAPTATSLRPEAFATCADLAARVVELRRRGSDVGLVLPDR
jgi:hypothetical protein